MMNVTLNVLYTVVINVNQHVVAEQCSLIQPATAKASIKTTNQALESLGEWNDRATE
jgi:hypothetical protein